MVEFLFFLAGWPVVFVSVIERRGLAFIPFKYTRSSFKKGGWAKINSLNPRVARSNSSFQEAYCAKYFRIGCELGRLPYA